MANIYTLRSRIKTVESTQKVTKTMKLVSTSKLHQTQGQLIRLGRFAEKCREALSLVLPAVEGEEDVPLLRPRHVHRVCYVLFLGDRGLCGAYNTDILAYLKELLAQEELEYSTVICGRWSGGRQDGEELKVLRRFDKIGDVPGREQVQELKGYLEGLYLRGEADKILLVYQSRQGMGQQPQCVQLLPLQPEAQTLGGDCLFEPDMLSLAQTLCRMYMENQLNKVLLEAKVSEHFARMTAMTNASDNADELIAQLSLSLNRTRQAKITTEITEIVGGSNALERGE